MANCIEWAEERIEECNEWRDEGHNECDEWDSRCCTWWPCNWFCRLITWICVGLVWIANWVCVGWTLITTAVCILWEVVNTIVNAILVTLESIFGWLISALAYVLEVLMRIPGLGAFIRWLLNAISFLIHTLGSVSDFVLGGLGVRPEKKLRICTVILRDENGTPVADAPYAVDLLQVAVDIFMRDANVRLIPSQPFRYSTGFSPSETVSEEWVIIDSDNSNADVLEPPCQGAAATADWTLPGSQFQSKVSNNCFFGAWRRLTGYGAPITCFIVRDIPGSFGCSLWITDYITVRNQVPPVGGGLINRRVIAHEVGHSTNLWHLEPSVKHPTNLMAIPWSPFVPDLTQSRLYDWQALLVRASKHVTYF